MNVDAGAGAFGNPYSHAVPLCLLSNPSEQLFQSCAAQPRPEGLMMTPHPEDPQFKRASGDPLIGVLFIVRAVA